jgi:alkanesulfonate monooxygenase SsuD/methylene tetrahydromethanopterin reductase-like flavin-dependent oxidoreductase (luciferase family)
MFAKAAATLDVLSGGRFEAGLGDGGFLRPAQAMGAPALTIGESLEALEEAVAILRGSWSGAPALRFEGRHYRLEGARPGPSPAHEIGIWLGASKPRALALTGRVADGWAAPLMNYTPPAAAGAAQTLIDHAAREAGGEPGEIRRIYNMPGAGSAPSFSWAGRIPRCCGHSSRTSPRGSASASRRRVPPLRRRSTVKVGHEGRRATEARGGDRAA